MTAEEEAAEDALYEAWNQEVEDDNQEALMRGDTGENDIDVPLTSYNDNKTYSFGPQTG